MKKYFIGNKGNFYKANLHTHTTVSDGTLTPEEVKALYSKKGYSIVAFTDHNVIVTHNDLADENFLPITSYELNVNAPLNGKSKQFIKTYHLNFYSKDKNKVISPVFNESLLFGNAPKYATEEMKKIAYKMEYSVDCINQIIKTMNEDGFLITLNHPVWSLQDYTDYINLKGLWGVEVYNSDCFLASYEDTTAPFTNLLRANNKVVPIASDDMHRIGEEFYGFSIIEAERLDYDLVLQAMEKGNIYSSNGPLINELYVENGVMKIKCDAVRKISLISERRWTKTVSGKNLNFAEFDLSEYFEANELYKPEIAFLRIVIEDDCGNKAWTRAYDYAELI